MSVAVLGLLLTRNYDLTPSAYCSSCGKGKALYLKIGPTGILISR